MCTAFFHKGNDWIYGFNMDIDADAFTWNVIAGKDAFYVAYQGADPIADDLPAGYADYQGNSLRVHGVTAKGVFAVQLNNMGCKGAPFEISKDAYPLYGVVDNLLSGRMTVKEAEAVAASKKLVNMPSGTIGIPDIAMHSLITDAEGNAMLLEPGNGYAKLCGRCAVLSNFPMLALPTDLDGAHAGFYGFDRYETANRVLRAADESFSVKDGLGLLHAVRQTGRWATRVSFVWSRNENAVYYALENDFAHVKKYAFDGQGEGT